VDGTTTMNCPGAYTVGIFYSSGSAGTVNEVEARNQNCSGKGLGILAENGVGAIQAVKIENNNIHDISYTGISTCSDQTPSTLTATITGNYVAAGVSGIIPYCNAGGTVSSNIVTGGSVGVFAGSASTTVSGNTIIGAGYAGVFVTTAASVISNHITGSANGIVFPYYASSVSATIKTNLITKSNVGIEFNCSAGSTITGNTINGAPTGFDQVPAAFNGVNKFYNVPTVRVAGGC
jgi:nitrous oxidase accessory protein NosD